MDEFEYSKHSIEVVFERNIQENWINQTLTNPDFTEFVDDEEMHYIKQIKEYNNRYLRVIVNPYSKPKRIITVFFDRRLKGNYES